MATLEERRNEAYIKYLKTVIINTKINELKKKQQQDQLMRGEVHGISTTLPTRAVDAIKNEVIGYTDEQVLSAYEPIRQINEENLHNPLIQNEKMSLKQDFSVQPKYKQIFGQIMI